MKQRCLRCQKEFERKKSGRFCSFRCYWKSQKGKRWGNPKNALGKKRSAETRAKMSLAAQGRKIAPEIAVKIGAANRGRTHSLESRKNVSMSLLGKRKSEQHRENIAKARSAGISSGDIKIKLRGKTGDHTSLKTGASEHYDSSYELRRFRALDNAPQVLKWTKNHGIQIRYKDGKKWRRYVPDILVELVDGRKFLEEVKGRVFDRLNFGRKNLAAVSWCLCKGMEFRILFKEHLDVVSYLPQEIQDEKDHRQE